MLVDLQRYVTNIGITASALRNLGAGGFVSSARSFLYEVDLASLCRVEPEGYATWLDERTELLMDRFPVEEMWGPARKAVNIFMTMCSLNRILDQHYELSRLSHVMEVALDSKVEERLRGYAIERGILQPMGTPRWTTIKALKKPTSEKYQATATTMAIEVNVPRGLLDVKLWEPG